MTSLLEASTTGMSANLANRQVVFTVHNIVFTNKGSQSTNLLCILCADISWGDACSNVISR